MRSEPAKSIPVGGTPILANDTLRPTGRHPAFAFACAYALFIVYATLLPFQFVTDGPALEAKRDWINWNPLRLVTGEPTPLSDLVTNVALFMPFGIIGFYARRRRKIGSALLRVSVAGMLLSIGVEAVQFLTPTRNPATSDVITNTLGSFLGVLMAGVFERRFRGHIRRRVIGWRIREPLLPIFAGATLLVLLNALIPFDLALTVPYLKRAVRGAQIHPGSGLSNWASDVPAMLQYAICAGLGLRVLKRLGLGRGFVPVLGVLGASVCLALGLELAQIAVRSRVSSTFDVLMGVGGAALGVTAALVLGDGRRARFGWVLAGAALVVAAGVEALRPFRFSFDPHAIWDRMSFTTLAPYSSYYYKANVAAVSDLLEGLLIYLPLGLVVAKWIGERDGRASVGGRHFAACVASVCALVALVLETLQLAVPSRYPDVSDVLTAALGGAIGAYAWSWIRHLQDVSPDEWSATSEPQKKPTEPQDPGWTARGAECPTAPASS